MIEDELRKVEVSGRQAAIIISLLEKANYAGLEAAKMGEDLSSKFRVAFAEPLPQEVTPKKRKK